MANDIVDRLAAHETVSPTEAIEVGAALCVFHGPESEAEFVAWLAEALPPVREHLRERFRLSDMQLERLRQRIDFYRHEAARRLAAR